MTGTKTHQDEKTASPRPRKPATKQQKTCGLCPASTFKTCSMWNHSPGQSYTIPCWHKHCLRNQPGSPQTARNPSRNRGRKLPPEASLQFRRQTPQRTVRSAWNLQENYFSAGRYSNQSKSAGRVLFCPLPAAYRPMNTPVKPPTFSEDRSQVNAVPSFFAGPFSGELKNS